MENKESATYINLKNSTAIFCSLNNGLVKNIESNCFDKEQLICLDDQLIIDVRYVEYKSALNDARGNSFYPLVLNNGYGSEISVANEYDCIKKVSENFIYNSQYKKIVNVPVVNIIYFFISIVSILILIYLQKINK